jgi:large subunit ribosomal protein L4
MTEVKNKAKTSNTKAKTEKPKANNLLISKAVRTVLANKRQAPAKTKTRGEVSGGGKKPWRQKGTGRARVGSSRSPIWRGGGVTFGPTGIQNFSLSINKKEMKAAREQAFESKKAETVTISVPNIKKTKEAAKLLVDNKITGTVLLLIEGKENYPELKRVFKNLKDVNIVLKGNENIHDILAARSILIISAKKQTSAKESGEAK